MKKTTLRELVLYNDLSDRPFHLPFQNSQNLLESTIVIFAFSKNSCTECVMLHLRYINAIHQKMRGVRIYIASKNCDNDLELYKKVLELNVPFISCDHARSIFSWLSSNYFPLFIILRNGRIELAWKAEPEKIESSLSLIKKLATPAEIRH